MLQVASSFRNGHPLRSSSFLLLLLTVLLLATTKTAHSLSLPNIDNVNVNVNIKNNMQKSIKEICRKPPSHWVGDGFKVFPVFANKAFTSELSPFLMFDYAAPKSFPPNTTGKRRGVGKHPHRGFETVTIAFQGEVEHADSVGNRGVIGAGDVQWMTAARGIVHEEFHSTEFSKSGGMFEMCQLWVNLPKESKMVEPRYQPILNQDIPKVELLKVEDAKNKECTNTVAPIEEGYVRIIAGEYRDIKGPAKTFTPINLWDIFLAKKESKYEFDIAAGHMLLVFVRRGSLQVQGELLKLADVAIMNEEGTKLTLMAMEDDTSVLILSGEPIDEPIAARGPFVMNNDEELSQAWMDYRYAQNGF